MNLQSKLQEIEKLAEAATPGPLKVNCSDAQYSGFWIEAPKMEHTNAEQVANANLFSQSRVLVPALARALGVSLKAMGVAKRYCECGAVERSDDESLSDVLDDALAEITTILLPEEKV